MREKFLSIGHTQVRLMSANDSFWNFADRRYKNFYINGSDFDETIEVQAVDQVDIPIQLEKKLIHTEGDEIYLKRGRAIAIWNKKRGHCVVKQALSDFAPTQKYSDYACDSFLRMVMSFRLLSKNGALIHSAGCRTITVLSHKYIGFVKQ
ncbi:hypothetical protein [Candidatus Uabimicrobium amorphum]|uniref:Uncharacterized protein n=1 Tax=Uabimicrobium amorphum TaxID=2596890 RepID=A0A5S9IV63_UABAM|nr:hypothetical protein [Candidatus Uabimicrobium amorphum]BBM87710.1 hypothetical protein UABAM_06125 [Candidatus Uabimicrobium amorphum]